MRLVIDASRNRSGGAVAYIVGILNAPNKYIEQFERIDLYAPVNICQKVQLRENLVIHPLKKTSLLRELLWQLFILKRIVKRVKANALFTTDSATLCSTKNNIVLNQDILPYTQEFQSELGLKLKARNFLLRWIQKKVFLSAIGVIFLSRYSKDIIELHYKSKITSVIISHGYDSVFMHQSNIRNYRPINNFFKIIYTSNYFPYKNFENVIKALELLLLRGVCNFHFTFVGGGECKAYRRLLDYVKHNNKLKEKISFSNFLTKDSLIELYNNHDAFLYASGCEAFGITLLEAMATGIPIISSNRSGLSEITQGSAIEFDPRSPNDIADALLKFFHGDYIRSMQNDSKLKAQEYSWDKCSFETFGYIIEQIRKCR